MRRHRRARGQEIETRNRIWRENLPSIERRWYLDGYTDGVDGRVIPARFQ